MRRWIALAALCLLPALAGAEPRARSSDQLMELGNRYFSEQRYLAASLAFEAVAENHDDPRALDAERFAISAAKKAVEQFGEDPNDPSGTMVRRLRRLKQNMTGA